MSILNLEKDDNNPLFLGQELGLQEYTEPRYPELEELALLQRSQFWTETEIDMSKDAIQWRTLDKSTQDISILNLSWQIMADSVVGRSPFTVLLPYVTNPELEGMLIQWGYFENLHSRAYSNMIRNVFPEPQLIINEVKHNIHAYERLAPIRILFEDLYSEHGDYVTGVANKRNIMKKIFKAIVATYGLESMQFYCSFACTFALAEQDVLMGFSDNLKLIAKDEALHTRMSLAIFKILMADPLWNSVIDECLNDGKGLLDSIRRCEMSWAKYLFSEGRQTMGLNANLLDEYLAFVSSSAYKAAGFEVDFDHGNSNPIPWIDKYLNPLKIQVAPQERQITNYRVGSIDGSIGDLSDIDF